MPKISSQISPAPLPANSLATASTEATVRYTHNVGNQVISVAPSAVPGTSSTNFNSQSTAVATTTNPSNVLKSATPSLAVKPGNVPSMNDEQKQIILDFKQSMVGLSPEAREKFIAQHKGKLMQKLNFPPKVLQVMKQNQTASAGTAAAAAATLPTAPALPSAVAAGAKNPVAPAAVLGGSAQPLNPPSLSTAQKHNAPLPPGIVSQLQNPSLPSVAPQPQSISGLRPQMPAMPPGLANLKPQIVSLGTPGTGSPMPKLDTAPASVILPTVPTGINVAGLKRPLGQPELGSTTGPPLMKHKKIAWVESQIGKDQNEVLNPQYKLPFKSKDDACKKLLRYHVYHELDVSPDQVQKEEDEIEEKASELMERYNNMRNKYHCLLVHESMVG